METIAYFWSEVMDFLYQLYSSFAPIDYWNMAALPFDLLCAFVACGLCLLPVWVIGRYIR